MKETVLEELKGDIGFGAEDAANVFGLAQEAKTLTAGVAERFGGYLMSRSSTREEDGESKGPASKQRQRFAKWLSGLFRGTYDTAYFARRRHAEWSLASLGPGQHRIIAGMELLWQELERSTRAAGVPNVEAKLRSLHKLLTLELAVTLDSYRERYAERVRRSERRAVEEKLTRTEHLAEIGQLAASLAHEIKNPLAGISGAIQVIRDAMSADDPHRPIVTEILGQIRRLDETVKDLLQYARPTPPRLHDFLLDQVVTRVLKVLRQEPALQRVRVECEQVPTGVSVYADDAQIEQLIINLVLNAAHASDDGGGIQLVVAQNNDRVTLAVRDSGRGMAPQVREQAFEPFFTTKAKGTGLGLSICRRIVEAHGGTIELESELNKGTTVNIDLPRRAEDVPQREKR